MTRSTNKLSHTLSRNSGAAGGSLLGALLAAGGAFLLFKIVSNNRSTPKRLPGSQGLSRDIHLSSSIVIDRTASDIYEFWRDLSHLPRVMGFLERVEQREGNISHWVARGPAGPALEWDSEIVEDVPGHRLSWRSLEGSEISTWGSVVFEPSADGRGTEVSVSLNFNPPGHSAGSAAAHFLKGLESSVLSKNLRNLKAYMEAGEIPTNKHISKRNPV